MGAEPVLLRCRWVLPCSDCPVAANTSILLEDGMISWMGGGSPPPGSKTGIVFDCGRYSVALPCFYNAHTHAAMSLLRGYYDDAGLHEWLQRMWFIEKRLDEETVYKASKLALLEMASGGTCGFMDMYFLPEATVRAAEEVGLRARLGPVIMGDVDPHRAVEEAARFAKSLGRDGLVGAAFNVHSVYAVPLEAVRLASEAAREQGVPLHIHVSETRREVYEVKKRYGVFPVELLDRLGALHGQSVLIHMGWVASWELNLVKERGASIVHCPVSNMKLATAGHFPLREALDAGITVGLGTDGAASNNTLDVIREMRVAVLLQRHSYWDTRVTARDALWIATEGSARAMALPRGAGRLEEGAPGDLVVMDFSHPGLQPLRGDNIVSAIVYAASARDVAYTFIAGRLVYGPDVRESFFDEALRLAEDVNRFIEKNSEGLDPEPPCSPPAACRRHTR